MSLRRSARTNGNASNDVPATNAVPTVRRRGVLATARRKAPAQPAENTAEIARLRQQVKELLQQQRQQAQSQPQPLPQPQQMAPAPQQVGPYGGWPMTNYAPYPVQHVEPVYERFRKQHAPNFEGTIDPFEAEEWLRNVEPILTHEPQ